MRGHFEKLKLRIRGNWVNQIFEVAAVEFARMVTANRNLEKLEMTGVSWDKWDDIFDAFKPHPELRVVRVKKIYANLSRNQCSSN